jgi:hypothetical protein
MANTFRICTKGYTDIVLDGRQCDCIGAQVREVVKHCRTTSMVSLKDDRCRICSKLTPKSRYDTGYIIP